ncbi:hypothetical protein D3C75_1162950 [compost metagenome]
MIEDILPCPLIQDAMTGSRLTLGFVKELYTKPLVLDGAYIVKAPNVRPGVTLNWIVNEILLAVLIDGAIVPKPTVPA